MLETEFDLSLGSESEFSTQVDPEEQVFTADLEPDEEPFETEMSAEEESFSADLSDDDAEFEADFGPGQQIHTERVRSVNGMVGDVVMKINNVELGENRSFGQLGVHVMTNMEIEALLSE